MQQAPASCPAPLELFTQSLHEGVHHPVAMLLLQIISILVAVRIFSWLFKYLGQPGVIGEIVAGIVLGRRCWATFSLKRSDSSLRPIRSNRSTF